MADDCGVLDLPTSERKDAEIVYFTLDHIETYFPDEPVSTGALFSELGSRMSSDLVASIEDMNISQRYSAVEDLPRYFSGKTKRRLRETTSSLAANAVRRCLEQSGADVSKIAALITVTNTPDQMLPGVAYLVMEKLQDVLPRSISVQGLQAAGCSGAVKALELAGLYLAAHPNKQVLVVAAEAHTGYMRSLDQGAYVSFRELRDRPDCREELVKTQRAIQSFLFGDGATAFLLGGEGRTGLTFGRMVHATNLEPSDVAILGTAQHGMIHPDTSGFPEYLMDRSVPARGMAYTADMLARLFGRAGPDFDAGAVGQLDSILIHTGSWKILEGICGRIGAAADDPRVAPGFRVIRNCANTSSCSAGFLLDDLLRTGLAGQGVLVSFGVGFSASSVRYSYRPSC
jgi:3-oxoacyl-[acyl-carrier-protein] synthase-3